MLAEGAIKLGVLADREMVFRAGVDETSVLRLDEVEPLPLRDPKDLTNLLMVTSDVERIVTGNAFSTRSYKERVQAQTRLQQLFYRSIALLDQFRHTASLELRTRGQLYPRTLHGIDSAWNSESLPQLYISPHLVVNGRTYKTPARGVLGLLYTA